MIKNFVQFLLEKINTGAVSLNIFIVAFLLGGWFLSKIFKKIKLPSVLGMIVWGIILGIFFRKSSPEILWNVEPFLKSFALIIILLRAGLGISKETLRKAGITAILMAFIPCLIEGTVLTIAIHFIFNFSWSVSGLTAFMLAAVSPAVIVPSMLDLKDKGYGKKNEIPTVILAGASVDDVIAITLFSIFLNMSISKNINVLKSVLSLPLSMALGIIPGIIIGFILVFYFKKIHKNIRATEKTLILITIAMMLVQVGNWLHSAALLGVMTVGFIILEKSETIANELAVKLSKIWIFAQIILFVLIGFSVDLKVAFDAGLKGFLVIGIGLVFRSIAVLISTAFSKFTFKEKIFCVIAYIPKATVQAALGSVALSYGLKEGSVILAIAVLSIIVTAPIGLIGIKLSADRLIHIDLKDHNQEIESIR